MQTKLKARPRVYTKSPLHRIPRVDAARKKGEMPEIADASTSKLHCNAVFMQTRPKEKDPFILTIFRAYSKTK